MTQKFKQLFLKSYANPTKETLGDLFGNPVLESTELVSSSLSILKCWEFRHYFECFDSCLNYAKLKPE